jgi:hypothetical protein
MDQIAALDDVLNRLERVDHSLINNGEELKKAMISAVELNPLYLISSEYKSMPIADRCKLLLEKYERFLFICYTEDDLDEQNYHNFESQLPLSSSTDQDEKKFYEAWKPALDEYKKEKGLGK